MSTQTDVEAFLGDLARRAVNTFWQSASSTAAVLWAGTGLNVADLSTVDGLHKAIVTVGVGAVGAGLSAVWALVRGKRTAVKARKEPAQTLQGVIVTK